MTLRLPAKKVCGPMDAFTVHTLLSSVLAYRPTAATTYQFYEEIDAWLGPWGATGYPIGYGKKYNILFTTNHPLNRDVWGRHWARNTAIYLQEGVRDYIVSRVMAASIGSLTENDLRVAAFDCHPKAYLKGGLLDVVEHSPELFLVIATIPIAEFNPTNPNFVLTLRQVLQVITIPSLVSLLRAAAGAMIRSTPAALLARFIWAEARRLRMPWIPPLPPGASDDNFWDSLGGIGGIVNALDP